MKTDNIKIEYLRFSYRNIKNIMWENGGMVDMNSLEPFDENCGVRIPSSLPEWKFSSVGRASGS